MLLSTASSESSMSSEPSKAGSCDHSPKSHTDWEGRAVFLSPDCLLLPQPKGKKTLLFCMGSSESHWNKLNSHLVAPGLRGLSDEQLKIHLLEHGQKKTEKNPVLSKARHVSVCAFQGNVATTFTTGISKETLQTWQHLCLQVK